LVNKTYVPDGNLENKFYNMDDTEVSFSLFCHIDQCKLLYSVAKYFNFK
jgi:hypothetical protein